MKFTSALALAATVGLVQAGIQENFLLFGQNLGMWNTGMMAAMQVNANNAANQCAISASVSNAYIV